MAEIARQQQPLAPEPLCQLDAARAHRAVKALSRVCACCAWIRINFQKRAAYIFLHGMRKKAMQGGDAKKEMRVSKKYRRACRSFGALCGMRRAARISFAGLARRRRAAAQRAAPRRALLQLPRDALTRHAEACACMLQRVFVLRCCRATPPPAASVLFSGVYVFEPESYARR